MSDSAKTGYIIVRPAGKLATTRRKTKHHPAYSRDRIPYCEGFALTQILDHHSFFILPKDLSQCVGDFPDGRIGFHCVQNVRH